MKLLLTILTFITLSASAQIEAYHLYKVHYPQTGVTVPNKTGTAQYYLTSNIGTTNEVADLDGNGVVNAGDITHFLGDGVQLWNQAQWNCGGKITQYQCFALWIQSQGMWVNGVAQYAPNVVVVYTFNPIAEWYWFSL